MCVLGELWDSATLPSPDNSFILGLVGARAVFFGKDFPFWAQIPHQPGIPAAGCGMGTGLCGTPGMHQAETRPDNGRLSRNLKDLVKVGKEDYKSPFEEEDLLTGVCERK